MKASFKAALGGGRGREAVGWWRTMTNEDRERCERWAMGCFTARNADPDPWRSKLTLNEWREEWRGLFLVNGRYRPLPTRFVGGLLSNPLPRRAAQPGKRSARDERYNASEKGQARRRRYEESEHGRARLMIPHI